MGKEKCDAGKGNGMSRFGVVLCSRVRQSGRFSVESLGFALVARLVERIVAQVSYPHATAADAVGDEDVSGCKVHI
jgi:hypothetical protein